MLMIVIFMFLVEKRSFIQIIAKILLLLEITLKSLLEKRKLSVGLHLDMPLGVRTFARK